MRLSAPNAEPRHARWPCFLVLALASPLAHAHGEDILASIFAEFASLVFCLAVLFLHPKAKPYRAIGFFACVAGVVIENWVLAYLPYMQYLQYRHLITAASLIVPPASISLAIHLSKRWTKKE